MERGSWQLKVDRAELHFTELEREIAKYTDRHAYRAEWVNAKKNPEVRKYVLRITEQPDPALGIVAGDVVHNLRSALDHLAVALAPRKRRYNAGFPIEFEDIWAKDESGIYIVTDDNKRVSYESRTRGMAPGAQAVIQELQPYASPDELGPKLHPLGILSKLENADKHRQLIAVATGLSDVTSVARDPGAGAVMRQEVGAKPPIGIPLAEDGTVIAMFGVEPRDRKVDVEVNGTPRIAVDVGLEGGYVELWAILRRVIDGIRAEVFPALEPFGPA